jgi:type I restriction enzyme, S subunit
LKAKSISNSWLERDGRRLDCGPYMSGALEARVLLERLPAEKQPLSKLCGGVGGGIYHAGREMRHWVEDPKYGIPFLGSTDILAADLSSLPLLAKEQVRANPRLTIHKGSTLITRSGTIGRMAFCRADMDGMACSEHVMRVVPDAASIPSGYVYAFLSSKFGIPMVVGGTYGSIIQSIEPHHIADLPIPRLGDKIEWKAHKLVEQAAAARVKARNILSASQKNLSRTLQFPEMVSAHQYTRPLAGKVNSRELRVRCDAFYFSAPNKDARFAFDNSSAGITKALGDVADIFIPGIFKRLYADEPSLGYPYITGADVFQLAPSASRFLMQRVAEEYNLVLRKGMILVQEAGQLGGLIGRSVLVGDYLDGFACTNNMVRITPVSPNDTGFIYCVLASEYGVRLIAREAAGSSIPHLEVSRIRELRIPWPSRRVRTQLGGEVIEALELRDEACTFDQKARQLIEQAIREAA